MDRDQIEDFVYIMLEDENFEDFLERFDITTIEVFWCLFENGLIDEEKIKEMMRH